MCIKRSPGGCAEGQLTPVRSRGAAGLGGVTCARCSLCSLSRCLFESLVPIQNDQAGFPPPRTMLSSRERRGRASSTPQTRGTSCKTAREATGGKILLNSPVLREQPPCPTPVAGEEKPLLS